MSNNYDPFSFIDEIEEEKEEKKEPQVKEKKEVKKIKRSPKPKSHISKAKRNNYLKVDRKKGKSDLVQEIKSLYNKELKKIPIEHLRDYHLLLKALIRARTL